MFKNISDQKNKLFLFLIFFIYTLFVWKFWFVCDDAFISFRYSKNLSLGEGLRYNLGVNPPVEGYSNFLWVLLGALILKIGLSIELVLPILSYFSGVIFLYLVHRLLTKNLKIDFWVATAGTLLLATYAPFVVWSTSGLATVPFALLFFSIYYILFFREKIFIAGLLGILLALLRAEGLIWAIFLHTVAFIFRPNLRKSFIKSVLFVLAVYSCYLSWRYSYYHSLVPNTVANKVGFGLEILLRGLRYASLYVLTFLTPLAIPLGLLFILKDKRKIFWPIFLITGATICYPILVGGDFMAMGRFFAPSFAFQAIILTFLLSWVAKYSKNMSLFTFVFFLVLNILPSYNLHLVPESVRSKLHFRLNTDEFKSEYEQWQYMKFNSERWGHLGRALKNISSPGESLVAGAIGNVGYYSDLYIYDRFGLVEPRVAKLKDRKIKKKSPGHDKSVSEKFFIPDKPTYLKAYLFKLPQMERRLEKSLKSWSKISPDYQAIYYPLEIKDSKRSELGMLVLKRKE